MIVLTREEAREYCKQPHFLQQWLIEHGIDPKVLFSCLNPEHPDHHPSMGWIPNSSNVHCLGCGITCDLFDCIAIDNGLPLHSREAMEATYKYCGVTIVDDSSYQPTREQKLKQAQREFMDKKDFPPAPAVKQITPPKEELILDLTAEIEAAHKELYTTQEKAFNGKTFLEYLYSRGLTDEIIKAYKLGYASRGYNSILAKYPDHQSKSPKIDLYKSVIPYIDENGGFSYFISEISDRSKIEKPYNGKYRKIIRDGERQVYAQLFNERYLKQGEAAPGVIFLCEGIYDALSVEIVGGKAIAFVGANAGINRFIRLCQQYKPNTSFIISLDNDQAGKEATEKLKGELDKLGFTYDIQTAQSLDCKDFNEALQKDKGKLASFIGGAIEKAKEEQSKALEEEKAELERENAASYINDFLKKIADNATRPSIKTGFKNLDEALDGGLYEGLYVIGAISGAGKTAFTMQIADNIAAAGNDVYIFSLEMSRDELMSRSISRISFTQEIQTKKTSVNARSPLSIRKGDIIGKEQKELVVKAAELYAEYADHIYINEGVGDIDINFILDKVKRHIRLKGKPPVIIVDYLQILAPDTESEDKHRTDKQMIDKAVLELKRLSRDYHIPVISVSSFNRENYNEPVNLASFKESGAIEYTASTIIGMQFPFMEYQKEEKTVYQGKPNERIVTEWEADGERKKRIREKLKEVATKKKAGEPVKIQVKILKYRDGTEGDIYLDFYSRFMCFKEAAAPGTTAKDDFTERLEGFDAI